MNIVNHIHLQQCIYTMFMHSKRKRNTNKQTTGHASAWTVYPHHLFINRIVGLFLKDHLPVTTQQMCLRRHYNPLVNNIHLPGLYTVLVLNKMRPSMLLEQKRHSALKQSQQNMLFDKMKNISSCKLLFLLHNSRIGAYRNGHPSIHPSILEPSCPSVHPSVHPHTFLRYGWMGFLHMWYHYQVSWPADRT